MIVLLSTFVIASTRQTDIFEGDTFSVSDGGAINIYDYNIQFTLDADENKVFINDLLSDHFVFVNKGECGRLSNLDFCFDRVSGNALFIRVFSMIPEVFLFQNFDEKEILVGTEFSYEIEIKNQGKAVSNDTKVRLEIPDGIRLLEIKGAEYNETERIVSWDGRIQIEKEHLIVLNFLVLEEFEKISLEPQLSFDSYYGVERESLTSEVSSYSPLEISYSPKQINLGTPLRINLTLKNQNFVSETNRDNGHDLRIRSFNLQKNNLPGLSSHTGFMDMSNSLFWSGNLNFNSSRSFFLTINPTSAGELVIPFTIVFNDTGKGPSGQLKEIHREIHFNILSSDIEIYPGLEPTTRLNGSRKHNIDIILKNNDPHIEFNDVEVIVKNEFGEDRKTLQTLFGGSQRTLSGFSFFVPPVSSLEEMDLDILVFYTNNFNEQKNASKTFSYYAEPSVELSFFWNISEISEGSYRIKTFAKNIGEIEVSDITTKHTLPENLFLRGETQGSIGSIFPGDISAISSYEISILDLNITAVNYTIKLLNSYVAHNVTRVISNEFNLNELIFSLYDDPSFLKRTVESIEQYFTSTTVFAIFLSSILVLLVAISSLTMYKKQFTISGYDSLTKRQNWIEKKKKVFDLRETKLRKAKEVLDIKIRDLTDFMTKTKKMMEKEVPVIEEKKDGLKIRQEELLREKKLIDEKIDELKEIETRLLKRNYSYEKELKELEMREELLNQRFNEVKVNLNSLTSNLQKLLDEENKLSINKEKLNKKELGIIAEKQKLIKMGSDKFATEKVDVIQEKVRLEHERNSLEEELFSLRNRKDDIVTAQDTIQKEKADLKKEKNIFDANKEAVESSLKVLREQSDKLKEILKESKESIIENEPEKTHNNDDNETEASDDSKK